jgi:hypothetical protein
VKNGRSQVPAIEGMVQPACFIGSGWSGHGESLSNGAKAHRSRH